MFPRFLEKYCPHFEGSLNHAFISSLGRDFLLLLFSFYFDEISFFELSRNSNRRVILTPSLFLSFERKVTHNPKDLCLARNSYGHKTTGIGRLSENKSLSLSLEFIHRDFSRWTLKLHRRDSPKWKEK